MPHLPNAHMACHRPLQADRQWLHSLTTMKTATRLIVRTFVMAAALGGAGRMASAAEVLVDGGRATVIRERESIKDLYRGEHLSD